jgi:hypothetical protein
MAVPFEEFKWRTMTAAINRVKVAPRLLRDLFFPESKAGPSDTIDVDITIGGNQLVPFISPVEGGTVVANMSREMRSVKTPRLRPKKEFGAQELLTTRAPGGTFYAKAGDITKERQRKVGEELADLKNRIDATKEWMCAQALKGSLTVNQENVSFEVDYRMPAEHKPTASKLWTAEDTTADDIHAQIQEWSDLIGEGVDTNADIMVMGSNAAAAFFAKCSESKWFDATRLNAGNIELNFASNFVGTIGGIKVYKYSKKYTDANGQYQPLVDPNQIILGSSEARRSLEHGLILDLKAGARVVGEYFAKSWLNEDPSVLWMLAESRPLPVLWEPEGIVCATVASS